MLMIQDHHLFSHTDNRSTADAIAGHIGQSSVACYRQ